MPQILLFGATGYTGRLTAHALARRGADFAIAGRNATKLRELARHTGNPESRVAEAGDLDSLLGALDGVRVLITCVGPFVDFGETAVEAALRAGVHYLDSTGEGSFIDRLARRNEEAHAAGIAMVPAMGFDEVPADVAATLATDGLEDADLVLTYAVPSTGSRGTVRSALGILTSTGRRIEDGRAVEVTTGADERWAPMPLPLGPRLAIAFPLASGFIIPMHLTLRRFRTYVTVGGPQRLGMKYATPWVRGIQHTTPGRWLIERVVERIPEGPKGKGREAPWTILAEARTAEKWRNVVLMGRDVYGLTAELLAHGALTMAADDFGRSGVLAPVEAVGLETLQKALIEQSVTMEIFPD
jgi:short subunit dehydrogenase-like uncharacterized protein